LCGAVTALLLLLFLGGSKTTVLAYQADPPSGGVAAVPAGGGVALAEEEPSWKEPFMIAANTNITVEQQMLTIPESPVVLNGKHSL
jgi:hypothetical protein